MLRLMALTLLCSILSCGGGGDTAPTVKPEIFRALELPEIRHHYSINYNGRIDHLDDNSWIYTGFTNDRCKGRLNSSCRKVDSNFTDSLATDRVIKYSFNFTVDQYNIDEPPYWIIIFQDWVRILPPEIDSNGNHPITTLKLKVFGNQLNLCHYDNSWQWGYDFGDNVSDTAVDVDHTLHQENTLNGCATVYVGMPIDVELILRDSGRVTFNVDGKSISDKRYQTKSKTTNHAIQWGQYWSKGYNVDNSFDKQTILTIKDLTLSELVK